MSNKPNLSRTSKNSKTKNTASTESRPTTTSDDLRREEEDLRPNVPEGVQGQTHIPCPCRVANYGIDTLHMTVKADIPGKLIVALDDAKKSAQSGQEDSALFQFGESYNFSFSISRTGIKWYQYVLRSADITICFSTRNSENPLPNMSIQIGSISCQENIIETIKIMKNWFKYHNIKIIEEKVSRIDLCADLDIHIDDTGITDLKRKITRAEKWSIYGKDDSINMISFGKGSLMLRVYDKIQEMYDKMAEHKEAFFRNIWGEVQNITRVEFQVRRDIVRQIFPRKSDFSTIWKFREKLWEYLTEDWFRHAEKPVDRKNKHQSRASVSEFWSTVQRAFTEESKKPVARKKKRPHINISALVKQAIGCLLTVTAGMGHHLDCKNSLYDTIHDVIYSNIAEIFDKPGFEKDYYKRMSEAIVTF